jgi:hypothetical protein
LDWLCDESTCVLRHVVSVCSHSSSSRAQLPQMGFFSSHRVCRRLQVWLRRCQCKSRIYKIEYIPSLHSQRMQSSTRSSDVPVLLRGPPRRLFLAGGCSMWKSNQLCARLRWLCNICSEMTHSPAFSNRRLFQPIPYRNPALGNARLSSSNNHKTLEATGLLIYLGTPQPPPLSLLPRETHNRTPHHLTTSPPHHLTT